MKFLKMKLDIKAEIATPLGDVSDEDIQKELTDEAKAKMVDEMRAEFVRDYATQGVDLKSLDATIEVVEI